MDLAVSNSEVSNLFDKIGDLGFTLFNAAISAILSTPTWILGWAVVILFAGWLVKKVFG